MMVHNRIYDVPKWQSMMYMLHEVVIDLLGESMIEYSTFQKIREVYLKD